VLLGSHLSVAGGMHLAALEAERLGLDCVQVFTKNQRQWKVKPLDDEAVELWRAEIDRLSWQSCTVSHASYLINLASPDDELWHKSIALMGVELERCAALGIAHLVHHPGAFTTSGEQTGLDRIVDAYEQLFEATQGCPTVSCLENTVGSGSNLGGRFEHLGELHERIVERTGGAERIGFCVDTCHAHAAGYDLSTRAGGESALDEFDRIAGLDHIRVMHLNDSIGEAGSKRDRHAHIGEGTIGLKTTHAALADSGFAAVMNRPKLRGVPMILETPKGETEAGTAFDTLNVRRLRKLIETNG